MSHSLYYRQWFLKPHIPDQEFYDSESHCEKRGDKQSYGEKVTEAGLQKTWHWCQSDTFSAGQSPKQTDFSLYSTQALSSQSSTSTKLSVTYIVPLLQCRKQGFRVGDNLIRDAPVLQEGKKHVQRFDNVHHVRKILTYQTPQDQQRRSIPREVRRTPAGNNSHESGELM